MTFINLATTTAMIIHQIEIDKLTQHEIAKTIEPYLGLPSEFVNWEAINSSIKNRWSKSARERVFTMAWKIRDGK